MVLVSKTNAVPLGYTPLSFAFCGNQTHVFALKKHSPRSLDEKSKRSLIAFFPKTLVELTMPLEKIRTFTDVTSDY